jgi:UDP-N-acetylmuramoylalanine--D-glutamate ligase
VLNGDDRRVMATAADIRAEVRTFRRSLPSERGGWWDGDAIVLRIGGEEMRLALEGVELGRGYRRENALAALLAACAAGAEPSKAARALSTFRGLPHRGERVRGVGGVTWVNDSKATNPGAALAALASQSAPVVWIAGGRDKGLDFEPLAEAAGRRVRKALLIGEAADKIAGALADRVAFEHVATLERAVGRAHALALPGDVVLLAPACASFDQFADFEERGERFRQLVHALPEEGS